jgi:predicted PurR-regulated permease PerM
MTKPMSNDKEGLVSESIVQLLFNQVKESSDNNSEAIKELTEAITELLKVLGTKPTETIQKLEDIIKGQTSIQQNFTKFFWVVGITFSVISIIFTIITFLKSWFPSGLGTFPH